ncbi:aromatic/alkene monooxygenase hydroxylase subunit beta [Thiothrix nivea]|uniref:Phenol 2-monooxygenase P1 subunit n=1 Tax=Thiothrix nivea (strain ATCC 35100 / DSM 5205 / JP2) TaxID=870187 RepID=A0A656HMY0_THINJ|nr:aromatic/alkene monooxygenase hydroxylase subunit beta [Thiothrix nivea]EIJ36689.1 phenol 2-monooxygenase P1 subunit [Thiothrix nivea DSM 5205]
MSLNISAKEVKPLRVNYAHVARRVGDERPASRYQEAVYDIQPTTNFHYPPTWQPEKQLYDTSLTAIVMQDWYAFTDPRQYYYTSYVTARAKQQESMDNNFELIEKNNLLASVPAAVQDQVRQVLIPLRHYEYGANMNNQDICHRGYGTTITSAASFNGFDRIGMAQYLSRIALLMDGNEETTLNAAKTAWMESPAWQPLRHAMEDSFVLDDWFEILLAQNVIMDGLIYPLVYERFIPTLVAQGGSTFLMMTQFMGEWHNENLRWTNQLLKVTAAESAENAQLLATWAGQWLTRMEQAVMPIAQLAFGDGATQQVAEVKAELLARLAKQGIKV